MKRFTLCSHLLGALTISKQADKAGYKFKGMLGILKKEFEKLEASSTRGDKKQEELGDQFFSFVNFALLFAIDPEESLAATNQLFLDNFSEIETAQIGDIRRLISN